jgi:DNA-binding MarR family transcriptional regulator
MRVMSDSLGFLLSDVARLMRRRFDERARTVGATRAQWKALLTLSRNEGINQGGLADLLEVEPITLCRMVDRLEESGLVERRRDPADRRAWQIFLTDAAQPVLGSLRIHADAMADTAFDGFDAAERTRLLTALTRIRDNLQIEPAKDAANG